MLFIYNELDTAWVSGKETEKKFKIFSTTTFNVKGKKVNGYAEIAFSKDITLNEGVDLSTMVKMEKPVRIYDGLTNVLFQQKDCRPYVLPAKANFNKDIALLSFDLRNKILLDVTSDEVYLLNYLLSGSKLSLVLSLTDKEEPTVAKITFFDKETKKIITVSLHKNELNELVIGKEVSEEETAESSIVPMKVTKFRPARPTYLIFTKPNMTRRLSSLIHTSHYRIETYTTEAELDALIATYKDQFYSAATLFVNTPSTSEAEYNNALPVVEKLQKEFRVFNVMLGNGKVHKF